MNKYIIAIKVTTENFPKFQDIPAMVVNSINEGQATIVSAEYVEQCSTCGKDLTSQEHDRGDQCDKCLGE